MSDLKDLHLSQVLTCSVVKLSGSSRGEQCSLIGQFEFRGKAYCHNHYAIASKVPHRFREAQATYGRRLVRLEEARKAASLQMDAFPVEAK